MGARRGARRSRIVSFNAHNSMRYYYFLLLLLLLINHRNKYLPCTANDYFKITMTIISEVNSFYLNVTLRCTKKKRHVQVTSFVSEKRPWQEGLQNRGPHFPHKEAEAQRGPGWAVVATELGAALLAPHPDEIPQQAGPASAAPLSRLPGASERPLPVTRCPPQTGWVWACPPRHQFGPDTDLGALPPDGGPWGARIIQ